MMRVFLTLMLLVVVSVGYENRVQMDENYLLQWSIKANEIVFEMQVRTHGYMGFGLSRDGTLSGADIFISWMDDGHIFFYDCHINTHTQTHEPVVDSSQDYELLTGSENATHTTLRFRRKLNTCDDKFDVPITNDTMNVIFLYHDEKPKRGQMRNDNGLNPMFATHFFRPLLLLQRSPSPPTLLQSDFFDIRNDKIQPPSSGDLHKWCRSYKFDAQSHHAVAYKPLFSPPESEGFITLMRVLECQSPLSDNFNAECHESIKIERKCLMTVALWTKGSEGFTFPPDVGFPLGGHFLLEIHFQDTPSDLIDSSGFRIFHTAERRKFEAGSLSISIRPNFLHIIAPGYKRVVSVGHCTSNCTQKVDNLSVFGVTMATHGAGTKVKISLVRNGEELEPIAEDSSVVPGYVETRLLRSRRSLLSGDHVMLECTYNTFKRERFTLGGESMNEEICMASLLYYPRQEQLVGCGSQSKVSDVLNALGIVELGKINNQTVITHPEIYANRTLEKHLELYDWKNEFFTFEQIIKTSPYNGFCMNSEKTSKPIGLIPTINKPYRPPDIPCLPLQYEEEANENAIDGKAVRSPSTFQQQRSGSEKTTPTKIVLTLIAIFCIFM